MGLPEQHNRSNVTHSRVCQVLANTFISIAHILFQYVTSPGSNTLIDSIIVCQVLANNIYFIGHLIIIDSIN